MKRDFSQQGNLTIEWKQRVVAVLRSTGVMDQGFTGQIIIDCNQGGITALTRSEKLK